MKIGREASRRAESGLTAARHGSCGKPGRAAVRADCSEMVVGLAVTGGERSFATALTNVRFGEEFNEI